MFELKRTAARPHMPGYGLQEATSEQELMPWSYLTEQMSQARNYWVGTTRPDGRPHVAPVWGVWMDETFLFSTGTQSAKGRNLARDPRLTVHLESGDNVVILEGVAVEVTDPERLARFNQAYGEKYNFYPLGESGDGPVEGLYLAVRLHTAFTWLEHDFPATATRWTFKEAADGGD